MARFLNNLVPLFILMTSFLPMASSADHHLAQAKIYVDKSGYDKWVKATGKTYPEQLKHEIRTIMYETNLIFRSLEAHNVNLQIAIQDIEVLNTNILETQNGKNQSWEAAATFKDWMVPKYGFEAYDLALLFTGDDFIGADGVVFHVGSVCRSVSVGIIELHFHMGDVWIAAHEIGHLFGAQHDGLNGSLECANNTGWISNSHGNPSNERRYTFSSCAADSIKGYIEYITKEAINCLATLSYRTEMPISRYASLAATPDEMCRRRFGHNSYIARQKYSGSYGDNLCYILHCAKTSKGNMVTWESMYTPEGLRCGQVTKTSFSQGNSSLDFLGTSPVFCGITSENKQCFKGKCVTTYNGSPYVSDTCPFGDQPEIKENGQIMTCAQMDATKCMKWGQACCHTCQAYSWNPGHINPETADEVCRRMVGPHSAMARSAYVTYGDNLCANLACLSNWEGIPWVFITAPDGMMCGKDKRCRNGHCVFSLHDNKKMSDKCPYGDQPFVKLDTGFTTCAAITQQHGCGYGYKETCCETCSDPGTADEICRQRLGPDSVMGRRFVFKMDDLCSELNCLTDMSGLMFYSKTDKAPDGMKCGKNKRCDDGKCVYSPTGDPNMPDVCPYGEQPWLGGDFQSTCKDYARNVGCGDARFRWDLTCCNSCSIQTPVQ